MLRAMGLERFNASKLKPHLKMSEQRLNIINQKKTNLIKQQKREVSNLLKEGKEEKARIRVESLIRADFTIEANELLALLCELVHERVPLLCMEKECPPDMKEAICTLIWAAPRSEVPELREVARQLELKYGKEFVEAALTDQTECVNTRVAHKMSVAPPSAFLVIKYLTAIAQEYQVDWTPADTGLDDDALATRAMPGPTGFSVQVAPGSNLRDAYSVQHPGPAPAPLQVAEIVQVEPPPDQPGLVVGLQPPVSGPDKSPGNPAGAGPALSSVDPNHPGPMHPPANPTYPPGGLAPPVEPKQQSCPDPGVHPTSTAEDTFHIPAAPGYGSPSEPSPDPKQPDDSNRPPPDDHPGGGPTAPAAGGAGGGTDYDSLAKRFESLKK